MVSMRLEFVAKFLDYSVGQSLVYRDKQGRLYVGFGFARNALIRDDSTIWDEYVPRGSVDVFGRQLDTTGPVV